MAPRATPIARITLRSSSQFNACFMVCFFWCYLCFTLNTNQAGSTPSARLAIGHVVENKDRSAGEWCVTTSRWDPAILTLIRAGPAGPKTPGAVRVLTGADCSARVLADTLFVGGIAMRKRVLAAGTARRHTWGSGGLGVSAAVRTVRNGPGDLNQGDGKRGDQCPKRRPAFRPDRFGLRRVGLGDSFHGVFHGAGWILRLFLWEL